VVEAGAVDATISASGTVVPEVEQVVTSPVEARVLRILTRAGAKLTAGQPIVTLDVSQARNAQAWLGRCTARPAFARVQQLA